MKSFNRNILNGAWPILIFVILFLVLPLATLPGFFNVIFVVLMGIALVIGVLLVASLVTGRRQSKT
jgi:NADH:ubiquinone oxidoreductase subunit 3 (subunit A)